MKVKICYNVEKIKKTLEENGYSFVKLPIETETEEWESDGEAYFFAKPEVKSLKYHWGFGLSATIVLQNGKRVRACGRGVTSSDMSVVMLDNNDLVSPRLIYDDFYIEATESVEMWLKSHGVSQEELEKSSEEFKFYETIHYNGVPTPKMDFGGWVYSSDTLVLDEKEIEEALADINDELLRKKLSVFYMLASSTTDDKTFVIVKKE